MRGQIHHLPKPGDKRRTKRFIIYRVLPLTPDNGGHQARWLEWSWVWQVCVTGHEVKSFWRTMSWATDPEESENALFTS
jgi:hypothetical protein